MVRTQEIVMSQQQPEKLTATTTPEKNRYDKPFIEDEGPQ